MLLISYNEVFPEGEISWVSVISEARWEFIKLGISFVLRKKLGLYDEREIQLSEKNVVILSNKDEDINTFLRLFPKGYHGNVDLIQEFLNSNDEYLITQSSLEHWLALRKCDWPKIERYAAQAVELQNYSTSPFLSEISNRKRELILDHPKIPHKIDLIRISSCMIELQKGDCSIRTAQMFWETLSDLLNIKWKKLPKDNDILKKIINLLTDNQGFLYYEPEDKHDEISKIWPELNRSIDRSKKLIKPILILS